ncbi:DUF2164 family protein [Cupriavidus sp. WS]|uniref:DUF2164 family protein n=1 Tax=Cupriavidus sp. WS TaxID=1312922 RepID=UPI00036E6FB4|nr:DUF2164 family protein [Cupriavidus sp. WS]
MDDQKRKRILKIAAILQTFLAEDLDIEVGNMELLDVSGRIVEAVRTEFYNEGLRAAARLIENKLSDMVEQISFLEAYEAQVQPGANAGRMD